MMKRLLTLSSLSLISICAFASDATSDDNSVPLMYPSNGVYIEPYIGYGYVAARSDTLHRNGLSGGGALGYRFHDHWAIDTGYTQLPRANVSTFYVYASIKYIFPITNRWDLFGKIGPAIVHGADNPYLSSDTNFAGFFDIGTTYWVTQRFGLVLQNALTTRSDNVPSTYNVTLGLNYYF